MKTNFLRKLPVLAFVLGLSLIAGMSSFKPVKRVGEVVYILNAAGTTYSRVSDDGSLPDEGGCTHVTDYKPCTQRFNTANDPSSMTFSATAIPANNIPGESESYWEF